MRIIPAIDIIDGQCVRLTQGDYGQKKVYSQNPRAVAASFRDAGLRYLHLVDLDGAKAGRVINWDVIREITTNIDMAVDFGGGVKTDDELQKLFDLGVQQVNLGSIAVKDPSRVKAWLERFGPEKIIISADVKNEMIAIHGWQESSALNIADLMKQYLPAGLQYVTCTDISTDGMLQGPNLTLYKKLKAQFPEIKLVASGGVSSKDDLLQLQRLHVDGVIVGKAIYEGKINITELSSI